MDASLENEAGYYMSSFQNRTASLRQNLKLTSAVITVEDIPLQHSRKRPKLDTKQGQVKAEENEIVSGDAVFISGATKDLTTDEQV